jgi:hypothetical protein
MPELLLRQASDPSMGALRVSVRCAGSPGINVDLDVEGTVEF